MGTSQPVRGTGEDVEQELLVRKVVGPTEILNLRKRPEKPVLRDQAGKSQVVVAVGFACPRHARREEEDQVVGRHDSRDHCAESPGRPGSWSGFRSLQRHGSLDFVAESPCPAARSSALSLLLSAAISLGQ